MNCKHCENEINAWSVTAIDGQEVCEDCASSSWDNPCIVYEVENGEVLKYEWCSDFGFRDGEYFEEAEPEAVEGFKYVRTDAWRGYYDSIISDGYTATASGWCTDRHDDVAYKHVYNDLVDAILGGEVSCPYKIVFAFAPTSNVFSVASDVIVREGEEDTVKDWIQKQMNISSEQIETSLK